MVPGDFTLFEASVFRYCRCHARRFSLLLHRHLPPSPAGRAGEPGEGVAVRGRPLSAAPRIPETAASVGAKCPARTAAAQPGRGPPPRLLPVFLCSGPRVTAHRWTLRLGPSGQGGRGPGGTATSHRLREQEAQPDPDAPRRGPEVTQRRAGRREGRSSGCYALAVSGWRTPSTGPEGRNGLGGRFDRLGGLSRETSTPR